MRQKSIFISFSVKKYFEMKYNHVLAKCPLGDFFLINEFTGL